MKAPSNGKQQGMHHIDEQPAVSTYFGRKHWPTRLMGSLLLLLACPLILLLVLLVRLTSPGRGMYRQARTGRHGREFMMYKIRTMYQDAELVSGPIWCRPGDSRITPVGKVLRLLHLDELPQLINVARGEMDLVGPRPERPVFVARLAREIPGYYARLRVLPGVTGLAQVNLPPDETIDCVRRKLALDCAYIRDANAGLDFRILLCTFLRMLGIRHGRAVRWLRLERSVPELPEVDLRNGGAAPYGVQHAPYASSFDMYSLNHAKGSSAVALLETGASSCSTALEDPSSAAESAVRRPK